MHHVTAQLAICSNCYILRNTELLYTLVRENVFSHMKMFLLGADLTTNFVQALSICLLTVSFSLFLLILSFVYINPDMFINFCDSEKTESVRKVKYSKPNINFILERDNREIVNGFTENTYINFFPDVHDIEIAEEKIDILESSELLEPEPKIAKSAEAVDQEALTAVKLALKLKLMNKIDKAQKLFQHALVLSPNHHDVLLHYGEFLESGEDFINADHFYLKAVALRPKNSRALAHRKRTLPVVNQLDLEELKGIESKELN